MPNSKSAKKRMRQATTRRQRNRAQRSVLRTAVKRVRAAGSGKDAQAAYREAERMLDRAAQRHLIHPNKAARDKSRLRKLIQSKA
ncbi:MAG: 30S ribosomal protein S20 [Gemmatimonadetes bacterium]|nr:30S ribosomal protein S20 [Gemmatimonadota bacterium]